MYHQLSVWNKSMDLADSVFSLTMKLPKDEIYSLTNQMRRCAVSIPSNIAEGKGRRTDREYISFLSVARGSVFELQTQLELCVRFGYLSKDEINKSYLLTQEIAKMLTSMISKLS